MTTLLVPCILSIAFGQLPASREVLPRDAPPQVSAGTASLAGTVVIDDATAAPLRRALVTLTSADSGAIRTATTDDAGRFIVRDLAAGRYSVKATKPAWLPAAYGAKRLGRPGTPVAVADAQHLTGITVRMTRGAVITGTVRDERGQPAVGIRIFPGRSPTTYGDGIASGGGFFITTDDEGTYRLYGLPPGDVFVVAQILPSLNPENPAFFHQIAPAEVARANQLIHQGGTIGSPAPVTSGSPAAMPARSMVKLATTFYPGTSDPAAAIPITLATGEERTGIDFTLHLIPTVVIEGIVTDASGVPQPNVSVVATSHVGRGDNGMGLSGFQMSGTGKTGHFRIPGIGPGDYTLMGGTDKAWILEELTVAGQDLSVPLTLQPNMTIAGRIVFDGALRQPNAGSIQVGLRGTGPWASILGRAVQTPVTNGRFAFENEIVPGGYQLTFTGLPTGWFVKSVVARGQETLDAPLEIGPNDAASDWVVTFTDRPSELTGVLGDAAGRPAPDYFIVVFPTDKALWTASRRIVQTRPASDGKFSLKNLPAGDYFIAAASDIEPGESLSTAVLESLVAGAARVKIADGARTTQDLKISGGS